MNQIQIFNFHAQAVAASGQITLPFQAPIEVQAGAALPSTGGIGSARVGRFRFRNNILSFDSAYSEVIGTYSEKDKAYETLASATVENLNILDVITCDRVVARLTSKHPINGDEPEIVPVGSQFQNLRIAGVPLGNLDLAVNVFTTFNTFSKIRDAFKKGKECQERGVAEDDPETQDCRDLTRLALLSPEKGGPESKGIIGCSMVRSLGTRALTMAVDDRAIPVEQFGKVYLGEIFVRGTERRVTMLRVELGCPVHGKVGISHVIGNGDGWP